MRALILTVLTALCGTAYAQPFLRSQRAGLGRDTVDYQRRIAAGRLASGSELQPPAIGLIRDSAGSLRRVLGVRANFILGGRMEDEVEAVASWGQTGLLKTRAALHVLDATGRITNSTPAPRGAALLGFTRSGGPAAVFFLETGELRLWRRGGWRRQPVQLDGEVVAVSGGAGPSVLLVLRRRDQYWKTELAAGTGLAMREEMLPGVDLPLLLLPDERLLFHDGCGLVLRRRSGHETPVPAPPSIAAMAPAARGWVHLSGTGHQTDLMLRLDAADLSLYHLPKGGSR